MWAVIQGFQDSDNTSGADNIIQGFQDLTTSNEKELLRCRHATKFNGSPKLLLDLLGETGQSAVAAPSTTYYDLPSQTFYDMLPLECAP